MELSLYKIEQEYRELANKLVDGELTEDLEIALNLNKENLQTKAVNYGFVCKQLDAECDLIDMEIERLKKLKESRSNAVTKLKTHLSTAMQLFMVEEIKTPIMKINFRKSESVEISDMELIPYEYVAVKETRNPDKKGIKEAIKLGIDIPGAYIQTNQNIQIK